MERPHYIDTAEALEQWLRRLRDADQIAVDTESDSLHSYREKVCLIQMTALGEDAIIDPLAFDHLAPLGPVFADDAIIKIFHDAGYDLICLRRDFGFEIRGLFDTMWASRLLGHQEFGLATVLRERFGVEANKRLQRSNWGRRPLSDEQIAYARLDTHFLPRLATQLTDELRAQNRLEWAFEDFARIPSQIAHPEPRDREPDANGFWRVKGAKTLSPPSRGRLQALHLARDRIAARLDRPPFKVVGDAVLVDLARRPPGLRDVLQPQPGLRRAGIERFGKELLAALGDAKPITGDPPRDCRRRRRAGRIIEPGGRERYEALRALRKEKAEALGLDPEVALSNALLDDLARHPPATLQELTRRDEFSGWRGPFFSDAVLALSQQPQSGRPTACSDGEHGGRKRRTRGPSSAGSDGSGDRIK